MTPAGADRCDVFQLDSAKVAALRRQLLSDASAGALAETFKLLGDATRVRMLDALSRSEMCVYVEERRATSRVGSGAHVRLPSTSHVGADLRVRPPSKKGRARA
jgi:DNA-binding transcriptional ArsR family regulator